MDRGAWWATVHGVARVGHDLLTKQHIFLVVTIGFKETTSKMRLKKIADLAKISYGEEQCGLELHF